jgi:hypothetical protein
MKISDIKDAINKKAKTVKPQVDLDDEPSVQIENTLSALQVANNPPHLFRRGGATARVRPFRASRRRSRRWAAMPYSRK